MNFLVLTIAATLVLGAPAHAQNPTEGAVKAMAGAEKKSRKKKVEICGECGKPETACECHGKDAKKGDKKTDHKHEHDEHAH